MRDLECLSWKHTDTENAIVYASLHCVKAPRQQLSSCQSNVYLQDFHSEQSLG